MTDLQQFSKFIPDTSPLNPQRVAWCGHCMVCSTWAVCVVSKCRPLARMFFAPPHTTVVASQESVHSSVVAYVASAWQVWRAWGRAHPEDPYADPAPPLLRLYKGHLAAWTAGRSRDTMKAALQFIKHEHLRAPRALHLVHSLPRAFSTSMWPPDPPSGRPGTRRCSTWRAYTCGT
jgi:hypothetical protein